MLFLHSHKFIYRKKNKKRQYNDANKFDANKIESHGGIKKEIAHKEITLSFRPN